MNDIVDKFLMKKADLLKPKDGVDGKRGRRGKKGDKGDTGETGAKGDKGDKGDTGSAGETGAKGEKGDQGIQGDKGEQGIQGLDGKDGEDGASAYRLWQLQGNRGTVEDFLKSLRGLRGSSSSGYLNLIPPQSTHAGQFLKTNGTALSWADVTSFTVEAAQDAIGAMVDTTLVYVDGTPLLTRAALTGDVTAAQASNALTLATVNSNVGAFGSSTSIPTFTVNAKGLITAASGNVVIAPAGTLTGTTLASNVVTSSLTTIGTLVGGSVPFSLVTGLVPLNQGGLDANLTASVGGIFYSTATAGAILSGTVTADKMLLSGSSAAPTWSTSTIPTSAGITANKLLISDGTNYVLSAITYPNASATAGKVVISDGTNYITSTSIFPNTVGTAGKIIRSDGTVNAYSTATFADTYTASNLLYSNGSNAVTGLATANSSVLVTDGSGVPSLSTNLPTAVTIGSAYIYRAGGTDIAIADGGTNASSQTSNGICYYNGTSITTSSLLTYSSSNITAASDSQVNLYLQTSSSGLAGPRYRFRRSSGTVASPTSIVDEDTDLGAYYFDAYYGGSWYGVGAMLCTGDGVPSGTSIPTQMAWLTASSGSTSASTKMTLNSAGWLGVGLLLYPSSQLHVKATSTYSTADTGYHGFQVKTGTATNDMALSIGADGGNFVSYIQSTIVGQAVSNGVLALQAAGGKVSIGTATALCTLTVNGQVGVPLGNGISLHSAYVVTNGSYALHTVNSGSIPIRISVAADAGTKRTFEVGYYASDNPASTWTPTLLVKPVSGFVSINTASSGYPLYVQGNANSWSANITANSTPGQSYGLSVFGGITSADIGFAVYNQNAGTQYFNVRGDGNVGVGIDPHSKVAIKGALWVAASGYQGIITAYSTNTLGASVGAGLILGGVYTGSTVTEFAQVAGVKENSTDGNYDGSLLIYTRVNGSTLTEKVRITAAGFVGIGASPTNIFDVKSGNSQMTFVPNSNAPYLQITDQTITALLHVTSTYGVVGTISNHDFILRTNNTEKVRITTAGAVGIGTSTMGGLLNLNQGTSTLPTEITFTNSAYDSTQYQRIGVGNSSFQYYFYMTQNATQSSGNWVGITNGFGGYAGKYELYTGTHKFSYATGVTAGGTITWKDVFTIAVGLTRTNCGTDRNGYLTAATALITGSDGVALYSINDAGSAFKPLVLCANEIRFANAVNGTIGLFTTTGYLQLVGASTSTSLGGGGAPSMFLQNTSNTTNNWYEIFFADSSGSGVGEIAFQCTDQTNHYGKFVVGTRTAGGYGSRMEIYNGMTLNSPTGGDLGAGWINVQGGISKNNSTYTNPDYVFEHYFNDGKIEKYINNPGAKDYKGLMSITEQRDYVRENYRFPNIKDDETCIFQMADRSLELHEEGFLRDCELHDDIIILKSQIAALKGEIRHLEKRLH